MRASGEKEKAELQQRLLDISAQEKVDLEKRLSEKFEEEKADSVKKLREDWDAEKALIEKKTREEVLAERAERKSSKKDHRLEAEKERAGRLEQEVESLRTVLEMKTEELHASRLSRLDNIYIIYSTTLIYNTSQVIRNKILALTFLEF